MLGCDNNHSPDFFKDVSFHVSSHVKFGNMGCFDFSINNPQNSCLVTWLLMWNVTFWVKYSIKKLGECCVTFWQDWPNLQLTKFTKSKISSHIVCFFNFHSFAKRSHNSWVITETTILVMVRYQIGSFHKLRLHFLTTYVPSLHFLCSKLHNFLTT